MMSIVLAFLAISPLLDDKEADEALKGFSAEFKGTDAERVVAVVKLAQTKHAKIVSKLGGLLPGGSTQVRVAAAKALGDFADFKKQAASALMNAIAPNAREIPVLDPIMDSLGRLQDPASVPILARHAEDKDVELAKRAVATIGRIQSGSGVDPLINLLGRSQKIVKSNSGGGVGYADPATGAGVVVGNESSHKARAEALVSACNSALQAITGESHGTAEAWGAWWAKNRATFKK